MKKVALFAVIMLFSLTACGKTLDGTYADASGMVKYKFSGHKVTMSTMGAETEMDYSIDGDDIKISVGSGQSLVMKIASDGTIRGITGPLKKIN